MLLLPLIKSVFYSKISEADHKFDMFRLFLHRSHITFINICNFHPMDWQYLYKKQLNENHELKRQLDIAESILRNFLPFVEKKDEQN